MRPPASFTHGALFYEDLEGFLGSTAPFLEDGIRAGEPALVAVGPEKREALREALPHAEDSVWFVDMTDLGRNPGRIISAWADFAREHADADRIRGIGEPVWSGRSHEEILECERHEALLNVAFADQPGFTLLCPYDSTLLDEAVLAGARHSHPVLVQGREMVCSPQYDRSVAPFAGSLPAPGADQERLDLADHRLAEVRRRIAELGAAAGLAPPRVSDLVLAVAEAATNSLRHAGDPGVLRVWHDGDDLVCEVRDRGWIRDPLAGRLRVPLDAANGRGLWLIHQLCDLVQIRSSAAGTVVRMHMRP